jgi:hypothetical protein
MVKLQAARSVRQRDGGCERVLAGDLEENMLNKDTLNSNKECYEFPQI